MEAIAVILIFVGSCIALAVGALVLAWALMEADKGWQNRPTYGERQARRYDRMVRANLRRAARLARNGHGTLAENAVLAARAAEGQAKEWRRSAP